MRTCATETASTAAIDDAAILISKLGHRSKRRFQALLEPTGLRPNHAQVITYLRERPGASQRDLVEALHVTPSMIAEMVDDLEQRDLVVRERRPGDRRSWAVRLTPAGGRIWKQVLEISAQVQDELLAPFDAGERDLLLSYLRRLDRTFGS